MIMSYTRTSPKIHFRQVQIQPWNADESNMMNLILESAEPQINRVKKIAQKLPQQPKKYSSRVLKEGHSYNFYTNLRKYERRKVQDFLAKKDVNFIERNIKEISEDLTNFHENSPHSLVNKMIQDKHQSSKMLHNQFSSTIEPIDWSLITQHEEKKLQKRQRHHALQNFLRFQSQNHCKDPIKQLNSEETFENVEDINKLEGDKYQKIMKLREGLRKRNLKSSDQCRRTHENTLCIEQNSKSSKLANIAKIESIAIPKTSHSARKKSATIKLQSGNQPDISSNTVPIKSLGINRVYTSHHNRIILPLKISFDK